MRFLSSSDLLNLWERGFGLHPLDQALLILGAGFPDASYESLADWPLGRRNHALIELRCACFGPRLRSWMTCSNCGERLEFEMDGGTFTRDASDDESNDLVVVNGQSFRLPTSRDLAQAAQEIDPDKAAIRLVESCRARGSDSPVQPDEELTDEELEQVGQSMALADPLAEILISLRCPLCGKESSESLDIGSFFWTEIEAQAKQLLFAVHTLASRYGWTEKEVLSLSEHRRAFYLEMVHE
jgi:hypothetical protein